MAYTNGDYLIRTILTAQSGLIEDQIINDFAVTFPDLSPSSSEIEDAIDVVGQFFTGGATAPAKVGNYISPWVDRSATHEITATQIVVGDLGPPDVRKDWLGPPAPTVDDAMCEEVAMCLSFHANLTDVAEEAGSTRPRARRRGRIYVGPLTLEAFDYDVMPVRPTTTFRTTLQARAVVLADDLNAVGWSWCVWSRADQLLRHVVGGWTDDAPDTQRRRGPNRTSRTTFGPVGP